MDVLRLIKARRSVRRFKKEAIPYETIRKILEAGRWAPSGLNNQPWKFMVLAGQTKDALAGYTAYSYIIKRADRIILIFLDRNSSYHREKDLMAMGASIENMLLYIHSCKLGACWLGEILNKRKEVEKFLKVPSHLQLQAVVALGKPWRYPRKGRRKRLDELIITSPTIGNKK